MWATGEGAAVSLMGAGGCWRGPALRWSLGVGSFPSRSHSTAGEALASVSPCGHSASFLQAPRALGTLA